MVPRSLVAAGAICLAIASAQAELNLTPRRGEYVLDGMKFEQLLFENGRNQATYVPPKGWTVSGSTNKLTLQPSGTSQAEAVIAKAIVSQPHPMDDAAMKKLTESALASVPPGSVNVTLIAQEKNTFMIGGNESLLITVSYTAYGEKYRRSVLFLNRGREQFRFQLSSREADFQQLDEAFKRSHFSWQNF